MKRVYISFLTAIFCIAQLCAQNLMTEQRSLTCFHSIDNVGSTDIVYTPSCDKYSVRVEAQQNYIAFIKTEVKDGRLTVKTEMPANIKGKHTVYVTAPALDRVCIIGSGSFSSTKNLNGKMLHLQVSGSGDIKVPNVECGELTLNLAGSGDITTGKITSTSLGIVLAGSGDIITGMVTAAKASVSLAGSGDIRTSFTQCDNLTCNISGSGDIHISGNVKNYTGKQCGTGSIHDARLMHK